MSFPCYARYKDSGLPWLGAIPAHWNIEQSRRLFALRKDRAIESDRQLTASQKHGVLFQEDYTALEGQKVVQVITGAEILKHVEPDDFVISMRSFQGGIEWSRYRGCISSAYVMLIPCPTVNVGFFSYLFKSKPYIQALQSTSNLVRDGQALRYDNFTQVHLPVIPNSEQAWIAAFLDRETAKIDALVAEQERLIELLKEKRQAVISHAVTKGLNPDAPMKDSGVGWIGLIPSHWNVAALGYLSRIETGSTPDRSKPEYWGGKIPWVKTGEIDYDLIAGTEECITEDGLLNSSARVAPSGTMLMAMYGQGVTRGRVAILGIDAAYNQACAAITFHSRMTGSYARLFFMAAYCFVRENGNETSQMNLSSGLISKMKLVIPPIEEQAQIVSMVSKLVDNLEILKAEAEALMQLLKERRAALISAAVTGKIDVRGLVAEQPEKESAA